MTNYTIRKSVRAKHIRITIRPDGSVIVTIPNRLATSRAEAFAESFVSEKRNWIEKKVALIQKRQKNIEQYPHTVIPKNNKDDFKISKQETLLLVQRRLAYFNVNYNYRWNKVTIKNITSRWGSCSKKGNLTFSYRIVFLTPKVADYLIVHELCHLGQFNHSKEFWALVEKTIPTYKSLRSQLKGVE